MIRVVKNNKKILVYIMLFFALFIGITSDGTYAYFTYGETILPAENSGTPVYNQLTVNYTDHTEAPTNDNSVTVYFDVSTILPGWNTSTFYYWVTNSGGTIIRTGTWSYVATNRMKFDSISTINPTDLSKATTVVFDGSSYTTTSGGLGGVTWSGTWFKIKVTDPNFSVTGTDKRYILVHRSDSITDQTSSNIQISTGVKEVYLKGATVGTGSSYTRPWKKLEIAY